MFQYLIGIIAHFKLSFLDLGGSQIIVSIPHRHYSSFQGFRCIHAIPQCVSIPHRHYSSFQVSFTSSKKSVTSVSIPHRHYSSFQADHELRFLTNSVFQYLIGIIAHFKLRRHRHRYSFRRFQYLIGIIAHFKNSGVFPLLHELPVSIPHRHYSSFQGCFFCF